MTIILISSVSIQVFWLPDWNGEPGEFAELCAARSGECPQI